MRPAAIGITALALASFAANSVLCRLALAGDAIDPATFTLVRILSGAIVLAALALAVSHRKGSPRAERGDLVSGAMLFGYAAAFSFAYVGLTAGAGALILFGSVQATMLVGASVSGQAPTPRQWLGLTLALGGLAYLVFPGLSAPPFVPALLMAIAGIAWGIYSLRGRRVLDPLRATAGNFLKASPLAIALALSFISSRHFSAMGLLLAAISGGITSGLGYALWYTALPQIGATRAAIVQLLVPVVTAIAGILLLGEALTARLATASSVIILGVAIAVIRPSQPLQAR